MNQHPLYPLVTEVINKANRDLDIYYRARAIFGYGKSWKEEWQRRKNEKAQA